jgi:hypothetical protein
MDKKFPWNLSKIHLLVSIKIKKPPVPTGIGRFKIKDPPYQ